MKIDFNEIRNQGNLELLARQLVEGFITGLHKSPYHGFSVEFAEHKLYNLGDSTRHIDWKVFAKTDRLYTRKYEEETNLRCRILIDNSSSMYYPQTNFGKITFSIMAAAALSYLLHRQRDAVGLTTFSSKIEDETAVKSTSSHIYSLHGFLEQLLTQQAIGKATAMAEVLHDIAERIHKRSLVILFSDIFTAADQLDEIFAGLQHLKHNKHEVLIFHVNEPKTEKLFSFDATPHEFIDLESGERLKLNPAEVKQDYTKQMDEYYKEIALRCAQLKVSFVPSDINEGYHNILNTFLIQRNKMR